MITSSQNTSTSFLSQNKMSLVLMFVVFLFSSVSMFGQTKNATVTNSVIEVSTVTTQAIALDSDADFINWFTGSRHTQTIQDNNSDCSTATSRKKQIISSGITPNKVLYRTFVKRVVSQENAIA